MYCPSCGAVGFSSSYYQGSGAVGVLLLLLFFPAWIIYEIWRHAAAKHVCPSCGVGGMVPRNSPRALRESPQQPRAQLRPPPRAFDVIRENDEPVDVAVPSDDDDAEGRFQVDGVDRESRMDTRWYCHAASDGNARAKAELEGIIVTRVVKLQSAPEPAPVPPPHIVETASPLVSDSSATIFGPSDPLSSAPPKPKTPWDDARIIRVTIAAALIALAVAGLIFFVVQR
jgi:hypothetical protein